MEFSVFMIKLSYSFHGKYFLQQVWRAKDFQGKCVYPSVLAFPEARIDYIKIALEDRQYIGVGQETESIQELKLALLAKNKYLNNYEL